jgi:hypothetical protein
LTANQQKVCKILSENTMTVNQLTGRLNNLYDGDFYDYHHFTRGQIRSILRRLWDRKILKRTKIYGSSEYHFVMTDEAFTVWKEQFDK